MISKLTFDFHKHTIRSAYSAFECVGCQVRDYVTGNDLLALRAGRTRVHLQFVDSW
jgi:hypothetical protein